MRQFVNAAVILVVVAIGGGLLVSGVARVRGAANLTKCRNNLKQIAFAGHNYASTFNDTFPLAAIANDALPQEQRLSWTLNLLPYIESDTLYRDTDKTLGWDHPANAFLLRIDLRWYRCPSAFPRTDAQGRYVTAYVAIAGVGGDSFRRGVFSFDRPIRLPDIPNRSATLLVVETRASNGPWPAAGWPTLRTLDGAGESYLGPGGPFAGYHPGIGTIAAFADGRVSGTQRRP